MSKIDAQRAMWKQRYERRQAAAAAQPAGAAPRPPVAPPVSTTATVATPEQTEQTEPAEQLCGHKNMGGRTCTRERGHAAKSHRYS